MKVLKYVLIFFGVVALVILIVPSFLAKNYFVSESIVINQTPKVVYEQIADFHKWQYWSPWEEMEVEQEQTISGTGKNVGDKMSWVGDTTGTGEQTFTKLVPYSLIETNLHFTSPQEGTSKVWYELEETANGTKVTWLIEGVGDLPYFVRFFAPAMESMLSEQFKTGLQNLKEYSESIEVQPENLIEMENSDVSMILQNYEK
jgi:hypothetical protein